MFERQKRTLLVMTQSKKGPTIALFPEDIEIPPGIDGLGSFRAWAHSESFPPSGRIDWIAGRLEVDMTPEDLYTHGSPKTAIATVLSQEIYVPQKGLVFIDTTRISSPTADLSAKPDILVVLAKTLESGHAHLVPKASGAPDRFVEIEGAVDLVVECISDSSARKDRKRLPALYHRAGIPEYWLVDARQDAVDFQILLRDASEYVRSPVDDDGFARSALLGKRVRLVRSKSAGGLIFFTLERRL